MTPEQHEEARRVFDMFDREVERHIKAELRADEIIDHITQNAAPMAYTREETYSLVPDCSDEDPLLIDHIIDKWANIPTRYLIPTDVLRARLEGNKDYGGEVKADIGDLMAALEVDD